MPKFNIRYHREKYPDLKDIESYGNFIDLRCAEKVELKAGDFKLIPLGFSAKIEDGYWAQVVPRSSTFKKWGILMTNSFGVIDTEYCGDDDEWFMPVYATRDTTIEVNDRICQFRLVKDIEFDIETIDKLSDNNRGGFGKSGIN
jgi:dUTP pyrophosphatase